MGKSDLTTKGSEPEVYTTTQSWRIVATPMEDCVRVHNTLSGLQFHLETTHHRRRVVCHELRVLCCSVGSSMTTWDHPQHVVIIQGDIPLQVAWSLRQERAFLTQSA